MSRRGPLSERALILAPLGRDAQIAAAVLRESDYDSDACGDLSAVARELEAGAGCVIISDLALHRADLAGPHTIEASRGKAFTAASARNTTLAMMENAQKNPAAATLVHIPGFLLVGGGVPIRAGNEVIGAVGVGGAPGGHLDEACANAAIDKVKDALK